MKFRELTVYCECGRVPTRIRRVGFTPNHELVMQWRCTACKRTVFFVKNLADCWRDCPKPEESLEEFPSTLPEEADARFLHSMGVRFPDEDQA